jgi:hypothetical protein
MPPTTMPEPVVDTPEPPAVREYRIGECVVVIDDGARCLVTRFADGSTLFAAPQDDDDYRDTARDLGYGDDTWSMTKDHELAHSWLASTLGGLPRSPTLWSAANPGKPGVLNRREQGEEETRVMAFQRFVRSGLGREYLGVLGLGGRFHPDDLRAAFLAWRDAPGAIA